jgi:hypothetical protein
LSLTSPEEDFDPTEARIEDLGALAVVRVYDWKSARNHGYDPMGYKDIPSDDPSRGGRFDATSAHSYPFCYYGVGRNSIEAALWEVAFNKARPLAHQSRLQLQQMEVQDLAFQVAVNSHECPMLMLSTPRDCGHIGAPPEICWDPNYAVTREWAQFIRRKLPDIHGICYFSRRSMTEAANVITFGDRCRSPRSYDGNGVEYRFVDDEGGRIFRRAAIGAGIDIVP